MHKTGVVPCEAWQGHSIWMDGIIFNELCVSSVSCVYAKDVSDEMESDCLPDILKTAENQYHKNHIILIC